MKMLLASSTVLLTILFSLAFGIACGYVVVNAILRAMNHKPARQETTSATAVMVTPASSR